MATSPLNCFIRRLTHGMTAQSLADQSDRELLERLLAGPNEAAFEALLRRHGSMVYRVCWRVLQHDEDCEDAFQATFLVFAQKLRSVKQDSLASWLHGVAHRVALRVKAQAARRRQRESHIPAPHKGQRDEITWREFLTVLDTELGSLPEKLRLPLIVCYLEGRTQDDAARLLGWSKSTLLRRLEEARAALGRRLTRKGFIWPPALAGVLISDCVAPAALSSKLIGSTMEAAKCTLAGRAAAGVVSTKVTALTEGVVKAMLPTKLKIATAVLMVVICLISTTAVELGYSTAGQQPEQPSEKPEGGKKQQRQPADELRQVKAEAGALDLLLDASSELRKLRSAAGTAVFETYVQQGDKKPEPYTKGKVQVYFDGGKYHLRYKFDFRFRRAVDDGAGGKKVVDENTPDDLAVIADGKLVSEVVYSKRIRQSGCQVNLRGRLKDATTSFALDHPAELWREAIDIDEVVKNLGRDTIKLTVLDSGSIRGTYKLKNAPKIRVEFEAEPADGYNVSALRVFNEGEKQPAQTAKVTWAKAKGIWYAKEFVTESDSRREGGDGTLCRGVFRYESFEPGAKVDQKLFTLDCLTIPPGTRSFDYVSPAH
jgi:RNA polymerase sigma factor (sigma-70 family)